MIKNIIYPDQQTSNVKNQCLLEENSVKVIQADMTKMIEENQNETSVAFAHAISADFNEGRSMSAGVAVVFRKMFGRPKTSDLVSSKLTCQEVQTGAKVYSLVTKDKYFGKPLKADYTIAFDQLTEQFKSNKNLKTLICSPMGCVRDCIQPKLFIQNLAKFQHSTDAKIIIVSNNYSSTRILRNGLSYTGFVRQLNAEIKDYEKCHQDLEVSSNEGSSPSTEVSPVPHLTDMVSFPPLPISPSAHRQQSPENRVGEVQLTEQSNTRQTDNTTTLCLSNKNLN